MPFDDDALVALGRRVVELEAAAVRTAGGRLDQRFAQAVRLLAGAAGRVIVSGSAPARCSTMVSGWWKRGRTSIQPVVPKTRA